MATTKDYIVIATFEVEGKDSRDAGNQALLTVIDTLFGVTTLPVEVIDAQTGDAETVVLKMEGVVCDAAPELELTDKERDAVCAALELLESGESDVAARLDASVTQGAFASGLAKLRKSLARPSRPR